jgi:GcrA cell cycle regulator
MTRLHAPSYAESKGARMQSTNWTPAHCDALREYLAKGMSYSEIAEAINATFATAYSRNATISRARRMGLAGCDRPKAWPGLPSKAQQTSLHKLRERYARQSGWIAPAFEREQNVKLRCVEIDPRHLSLSELERGHCRYPYGGDEGSDAITFCGHPRRLGSSYCAPHFDLTRRPGTVSERVTPTREAEQDIAVEASAGTAVRYAPVALMRVRLQRLPRRHRIAHLRALIRQLPDHSSRVAELVELLRDEMSLLTGQESRAG